MGIRLLMLLVALWLLGSLTPVGAQDQRSALLKADQQAARLAIDSGFAIALGRTLRHDGVLLWPQAPILAGNAQIHRFIQDSSRSDPLRLTWQPLELELSRDSALAALWGVALLQSHTPTGAPSLGRFISVWSRDQTTWSMTALVLIGIPVSATSGTISGVPTTRRPARFTAEAEPFAAADRAFARLAKDSGAATAFRTWADDGALIFGGGGLITRGPAAIGRAVNGPERWDWHPVLAGGAPSGDLGWTVGEAVIEGADGKPSYSKYLTVWSRRGNTIRFVLDGGNARPQPGT